MARNWARERKIHPLRRFDPCVVRGSPLCLPYSIVSPYDALRSISSFYLHLFQRYSIRYESYDFIVHVGRHRRTVILRFAPDPVISSLAPGRKLFPENKAFLLYLFDFPNLILKLSNQIRVYFRSALDKSNRDYFQRVLLFPSRQCSVTGKSTTQYINFEFQFLISNDPIMQNGIS